MEAEKGQRYYCKSTIGVGDFDCGSFYESHSNGTLRDNSGVDRSLTDDDMYNYFDWIETIPLQKTITFSESDKRSLLGYHKTNRNYGN